MEFGRLPITELDKVDFTLPQEPSENSKVLAGRPARGKLYVGMPRWGRSEWVGKLYPQKTKEKDFLSHYVNHFNSVELNATHYKLYGSGGIGKWADMARDIDFKFCPKMYQGVTHRGTLKGKDFITNEFIQGIGAFGEHLGVVFVQVSDHFSPNRRKELFDYFASLPKDMQFFLEVRHPGWFAKPEVQKEMFATLSSLNIGAVITDTAGRRDSAHMNLTIPKTMIRFIANNHHSDNNRIAQWGSRIKLWLDQGIEEVYFFVHAEDEEKGLDVAKYVIEKFNDVCKTDIPNLKFLN